MTQNLEVVHVSWIHRLKDHGRVGDMLWGRQARELSSQFQKSTNPYTTVGLVTLSGVSVTLVEPSNGNCSMWDTNTHPP